MCCRYYMELSPRLRPIVEEAKRSRLYANSIHQIAKPLTTEGEVFPGSMVPVLATNKAGEKAVFPMIWGYNVPGIHRLIANARCETAAEKSSFKESWATHRCVVPASWYYEWSHVLTPSGKQNPGEKYAIQPKEEQLTYLCVDHDMPLFPAFRDLDAGAGRLCGIYPRSDALYPAGKRNRPVDRPLHKSPHPFTVRLDGNGLRGGRKPRIEQAKSSVLQEMQALLLLGSRQARITGD